MLVKGHAHFWTWPNISHPSFKWANSLIGSCMLFCPVSLISVYWLLWHSGAPSAASSYVPWLVSIALPQRSASSLPQLCQHGAFWFIVLDFNLSPDSNPSSESVIPTPSVHRPIQNPKSIAWSIKHLTAATVNSISNPNSVHTWPSWTKICAPVGSS